MFFVLSYAYFALVADIRSSARMRQGSPFRGLLVVWFYLYIAGSFSFETNQTKDNLKDLRDISGCKNCFVNLSVRLIYSFHCCINPRLCVPSQGSNSVAGTCTIDYQGSLGSFSYFASGVCARLSRHCFLWPGQGYIVFVRVCLHTHCHTSQTKRDSVVFHVRTRYTEDLPRHVCTRSRPLWFIVDLSH